MTVNFTLVGGPRTSSTGLSVIRKAASGAGQAAGTSAAQVAKPILMLPGDVAAPAAKGFLKTKAGKVILAAVALLAATGAGKLIYDKVQEKKAEKAEQPAAPETGANVYSFA